MTKLTEDILRAQTCPFVLENIIHKGSDVIEINYIGKNTVLYAPRGDFSTSEYVTSIESILTGYKLPEPEPKLVTMHECVDRFSEVKYMDENFRTANLSLREWSTHQRRSVRIPNGRTMQLDISGDQWKWVVE